MLKKLPIDVGSFTTMINGDYLYIDKTQYIYDLICASRFYFLSRPRRFGKSLFISTIKELFLGNKDLFKNLWIGTKSNYQWPVHPVIHLDFSSIDHRTSQELMTSLLWRIDQIGLEYGIDLTSASVIGSKLQLLIPALSQKNGVVFLIDEYDKPLLRHIDNRNVAKECREILKAFYETIKSLDQHFRAIFVTGVSKFSKISLFSGMNNLNDISMDSNVAGLFGYSHQELTTYFSEHIQVMAQKMNKQPNEIIDEMTLWYDGYQFSDADLKVYNPISVLYYLHKHKRANYWLETATPEFLVHLLEQQSETLIDFESVDFSQESLGKIDIDSIPLITILFQTGYLTIKSHNPETNTYRLTLPNAEVRDSFDKYIVALLSHNNSTNVESSLAAIKRALAINDMHLFCITLRSLFAGIPYNLHIMQESYYHSLLHFLVDMLGLDVHSEVAMSRGRVDMVLITKERIYVMEFKFDKTAQEAINQINDRSYYEKYLAKGKPITLVGISFNYQDKKFYTIDWETVEVGV